MARGTTGAGFFIAHGGRICYYRLMETKLLYLEDFTRLECEAKIIDRIQKDGKDILILDATVFYPQGGGQPYDTGMIESASGKFLVEEVRFMDGMVRHIGHVERGSFQTGETVQCRIDAERRLLHSRIHSAGHLVDLAVNTLALPWTPGKGYHFPQGPYVEYAGALRDTDKEKLKSDIERVANNAIQKGQVVAIRFMPKEEMASVVRFVPDNIPAGKPGRVVMFGSFGVPCGGTHVKNLSEIGRITIRKIKQEDKHVRVGYDVTQ